MTQNNSTYFYLQDILQAYIQSAIKLNQDFYIKAPLKFNTAFKVLQNIILKNFKPLYGIPEAGNHWFKIYYNHHIKELNINQSIYNPCLFHLNNPINFKIIGLQTNNTFLLANLVFAVSKQEKIKKAKFPIKERKQLMPKHPIKFSKGIIQQ